MKTLIGTVTSTKTQKTATVIVERSWRHPLYKKVVRRTKKYLAHDNLGVKVGEKVLIKETKPISKRKRWVIVEKNKKSTKPKPKTAKK